MRNANAPLQRRLAAVVVDGRGQAGLVTSIDNGATRNGDAKRARRRLEKKERIARHLI